MKTVEIMLTVPGYYAISHDAFQRSYAIVIVEGGGRCEQLTPAPRFARDGELRPGRWNLATRALGPCASPQLADALVQEMWREARAARLGGHGTRGAL